MDLVSSVGLTAVHLCALPAPHFPTDEIEEESEVCCK